MFTIFVPITGLAISSDTNNPLFIYIFTNISVKDTSGKHIRAINTPLNPTFI